MAHGSVISGGHHGSESHLPHSGGTGVHVPSEHAASNLRTHVPKIPATSHNSGLPKSSAPPTNPNSLPAPPKIVHGLPPLPPGTAHSALLPPPPPPSALHHNPIEPPSAPYNPPTLPPAPHNPHSAPIHHPTQALELHHKPPPVSGSHESTLPIPNRAHVSTSLTEPVPRASSSTPMPPTRHPFSDGHPTLNPASTLAPEVPEPHPDPASHLHDGFEGYPVPYPSVTDHLKNIGWDTAGSLATGLIGSRFELGTHALENGMDHGNGYPAQATPQPQSQVQAPTQTRQAYSGQAIDPNADPHQLSGQGDMADNQGDTGDDQGDFDQAYQDPIGGDGTEYHGMQGNELDDHYPTNGEMDDHDHNSQGINHHDPNSHEPQHGGIPSHMDPHALVDPTHGALTNQHPSSTMHHDLAQHFQPYHGHDHDHEHSNDRSNDHSHDPHSLPMGADDDDDDDEGHIHNLNSPGAIMDDAQHYDPADADFDPHDDGYGDDGEGEGEYYHEDDHDPESHQAWAAAVPQHA